MQSEGPHLGVAGLRGLGPAKPSLAPSLTRHVSQGGRPGPLQEFQLPWVQPVLVRSCLVQKGGS